MGKGDRRTRRGKIRIGTFGNSRRKRPLHDLDTGPNKVKKLTATKGTKKPDKVKKDIKAKLEAKKAKKEIAVKEMVEKEVAEKKIKKEKKVISVEKSKTEAKVDKKDEKKEKKEKKETKASAK